MIEYTTLRLKVSRRYFNQEIDRTRLLWSFANNSSRGKGRGCVGKRVLSCSKEKTAAVLSGTNKSLGHFRRRVSSSWWGIPYGMNSVSNDHPSAYYHRDYEPFVYFIMALNLRGFTECGDVKPSPTRIWRSRGLFDVAHRVPCASAHFSAFFKSLNSSPIRLLLEIFMCSSGMAVLLGFL